MVLWRYRICAHLRQRSGNPNQAARFRRHYLYPESAVEPIQDPRGITAIRNTFDATGRLISSTDANGKSVTYIHDLNGHTETIVDRLSSTNVLTYDTKGNVTQSVNALNQTNKYAYDSNNNKI